MNRRKQEMIFQNMKSQNEMLKQSTRKKTDRKTKNQEDKV